MHIIVLIDDVYVIERVIKRLKAWNLQPDTVTPAGPVPPLPHDGTSPSPIPGTGYRLNSTPGKPLGPQMAESPRFG